MPAMERRQTNANILEACTSEIAVIDIKYSLINGNVLHNICAATGIKICAHHGVENLERNVGQMLLN